MVRVIILDHVCQGATIAQRFQMLNTGNLKINHYYITLLFWNFVDILLRLTLLFPDFHYCFGRNGRT